MRVGRGRADVVGVLFTVMALYVLVRPRSRAVDLVRAVSAAGVALVNKVTELERKD